MKREASLATLRRLAEAMDDWYGNVDLTEPLPGWDECSRTAFAAMLAYRREIAPLLRTKAEVDAEIADLVRPIVEAVNPNYQSDWRRIRELCKEPTSAYGPAGAAAKESREDIAAPGGATREGPGCPHSTPWCESCERAQKLWGVITNPCSVPEADPERQPCPTCDRPMARVAGFGWTCLCCNAAGDPEEDHPDDRPCGCEDTEALRQAVRDAEGRYRQVVAVNHANEAAHRARVGALLASLKEIREQFEGWRDHDVGRPAAALTAIGRALGKVNWT